MHVTTIDSSLVAPHLTTMAEPSNFKTEIITANDAASPLFRVSPRKLKKNGEEGFSLIEATVAMVVFLIAMLGVFATFTYTINYNAGNQSRAQALAILQRKVEQLRSAKFLPNGVDAELAGGVKAPEIVTGADGHRFRIEVRVDDNPQTPAIDTVNASSLKEITVTVTLDRPTPGWQTSVPATVVLRRVRGN